MTIKEDFETQEMHKITKRIIFLLFILVVVGCNKNEIGPQGNENGNPTITITPETLGYLVINEGNFGNGNSSLSYLDWSSSTITNNVYSTINNETLGDIFQSIQRIENQYYFVVNNSQKIIVTDTSFHKVTTIDGFTSPRHIAEVNDNKAYITDLFSNEISILDLTTNQITGSISVAGWTEEMMKIENQIWVEDITNSKLLAINPETDIIENEIQLSAGLSNMIQANDNTIWVMCDGGYTEPILPKLYHINPSNHSIVHTFTFGETEAQPRFLTYNSNDDVLYYFQGGIRRMSTTDENLPSSIFIPTNLELIYGLDYDPDNQLLLITDARDYISLGELIVYTDDGTWVNTFDTGVNPNGVFIKK